MVSADKKFQVFLVLVLNVTSLWFFFYLSLQPIEYFWGENKNINSPFSLRVFCILITVVVSCYVLLCACQWLTICLIGPQQNNNTRKNYRSHWCKFRERVTVVCPDEYKTKKVSRSRIKVGLPSFRWSFSDFTQKRSNDYSKHKTVCTLGVHAGTSEVFTV